MPPNVPEAIGRYEVVGFLAAGGMAELFLGRTRGPSGFTRPVVLKRILPHLARQQGFVDMFLDEARIVARVRHPNVVQVTELGHEGGELFMVMEYLEGESLAGLMRRVISRGEALEPMLAAYLVAEACSGLHAAHELGVVHRDVSPQNLFVTFGGSVKVLDFGIARAEDRVTRTEAGQVKGKLDYMSPEQCLSRPLDRRSDVFALGVVLYELLTLRRLFKRGTQIATLRAILEEPVVPPSRLNPACPPGLERICLRALAKPEGDRYASAAELRHELMAAVAASWTRLPEEALGELMSKLFPDRKTEKEEMLRRVGEGSRPTSLPAAEVDDSIEVLEVPPSPAPAAPRRPAFAIVSAAGLLIGGLGVFSVLRPRAEDPVVVQVPAPKSAEPAPPRTVQVNLETSPPGAAVHVEGVMRGVTPVALSFPASDTRVELEVRLEGHVPVKTFLQLATDQRLSLALQPLRPPAREKPRKTKPRPIKPGDPLEEKW